MHIGIAALIGLVSCADVWGLKARAIGGSRDGRGDSMRSAQAEPSSRGGGR